MKYTDFLAMLVEAKIEYTSTERADGGSTVVVKACCGPNNEGYGGCSTTLTFDALGALECMGAWKTAAA